MILHEMAREDPNDVVSLVTNRWAGDRGRSWVDATVCPKARKRRRVHRRITILIVDWLAGREGLSIVLLGLSRLRS